MRLVVTIFVGALVGFFLGVSFSTISLTKMNLPSTLFPSIDLSYIEEKYSRFSTQALLSAWSSLKGNKQHTEKYVSQETKIWVPTSPRGTESLAPSIIASESDFYLHRLWGLPSEDLLVKPKYLVTLTVGCAQKNNVDAAVKKVNSLNNSEVHM